MSFPRYAKYKDSGVEWIGEVPEHWRIIPLKRLVSLRSGEAITSEQIEDNGSYEVLGGNGHRGFCELYTHEGRFVLIGRQGALCGNINYAEGRFWASEHALVVTPRQTTEAFWLGELLRAMNLNQHSTSAAQPGLSADVLNNLQIPIPSLEEQLCLAQFLRHETTTIDALVAEQERLIGLLKEKRQAVISHAVTKGLDPNAPMKDSGVEWLGDVPSHWAVYPLKRDLLFLTSGSRGWAEHYSDDGTLFLRIGNLTRDSTRLDLSDVQRVEVPEGSEGARTRVEPGDILFSITAYLGSVAVVPEELETAYVSQHVALARMKPSSLLPQWVAYVSLSWVGKTYLQMQGYGGTKVQLALDDVAGLLMCVPPSNEQIKIIKWLNEKTSHFDELIGEAKRGIALLQERRSALIAAAVTGMIDVRNFVASDAEAA